MGKEKEVRAVHLRCLRVFWHKHWSGLSQQAPASFLEWGKWFIQPLLTLGCAAQHRGSKEDAQGHGEIMLGGPSPDTAVVKKWSPLFLVFVALGGCQFRVRTSLYLMLIRLRAIPCPFGGTYRHSMHRWHHGDTAHPMGQLPAL